MVTQGQHSVFTRAFCTEWLTHFRGNTMSAVGRSRFARPSLQSGLPFRCVSAFLHSYVLLSPGLSVLITQHFVGQVLSEGLVGVVCISALRALFPPLSPPPRGLTWLSLEYNSCVFYSPFTISKSSSFSSFLTTVPFGNNTTDPSPMLSVSSNGRVGYLVRIYFLLS